MLAAASTDAEHWRAGFACAFMGVILVLILKSRLVLSLRDRLALKIPRDRLVALLCAVAFVFLVAAALILASALAVAIWPIAGDASPSFMDAALGLPAEALMGGLVLWSMLAALRRWPRWGWAGLSAGAAGLIFCAVLIPPVALSPMARHDSPATGAPSAPLLAFIHKGGLNARSIEVFDSADPVAVDMEGLGPIAHAGVSRAALAAPRPETYAAIGHLLGHYHYGDLWSLALLWSAFATAFLGAVWFFLGRLMRRGGQNTRNSAAAAKAYPLVGLLGWCLVLIATPAFNLFDQAINYRADDYALSLTHDPEALCRWLIATEAAGKADPSPLEALLFYDHPPLKPRLINALRWSVAPAHSEGPF